MSLAQPLKRLSTALSSLRRSQVISWQAHWMRVSLATPVVAISVVVGGALVGIQQLGLLENWDLAAYDQMVRLRPQVKDDQRILVIKITESDIRNYNNDDLPLTDAILSDLLTKLAKHQPLVIGLDIYRHIPQPPGHQELAQLLQKNQTLVPVCKIANDDNPGIPPPPLIPQARAGFSDLVVDSGGIVRRGLLFAKPTPQSRCQATNSFSFQLAYTYLNNTQGIKPQNTPEKHVQLGKATFKRLRNNSGGYQDVDSRGVQILLNYRSPEAGVQILTLNDLFTNQFEPSQIKDKVVVIGVSAESGKDLFYTPYSAGIEDNQKMPGVIVHAQLTSQIISAALGENQLFWFVPEWGEAIWVVSCSLLGGVVAYLVRHPLRLATSETAIFGLILVSTGCIFLSEGWLPIVTPSLALVLSTILVMAYTKYQTEREHQQMAQLVERQDRDLVLLQELLKKDQHSAVHEAETVTWHTAQTELPPDSLAEDEDDFATIIAPEGEPWQPKAHLLAGRYKITEVLGAGGFGSTYLAEDSHLPNHPKCVVKRLQTASKDQRFLKVAKRLFDTEAKILGKLGHHPQIPRLLAHFEEQKEFYLVEEYIAGSLLADELRQAQRFPPQHVIELLRDVLSTLEYVHSQLVIHRDLKPTNLIRSQHSGRLVLIDFGAVKQIKSPNPEVEEAKTVAIGTKGYTPPEQYAGHPNFSSDLYALGMIAIQSLTGVTPNKIDVNMTTGNLKLENLLREVNPKLTMILAKMVRYHFQERYQSTQAVLEDLHHL